MSKFFDFIKLLSKNPYLNYIYSVGCATLCLKSEVMLQANQDSWLKAKAGARIPVKTINKSTHTNIFIYSIFLFGKKLELCRTSSMLYVWLYVVFLLEEVHFMEHFPLTLCQGRAYKYHKVASTSPFYFEAHAGLFRLSIKG